MVLMICAAMMVFGQVKAQQNEKDTTATMVTSTNASLRLRADILPDYIQLQWTKGPDDLTAYFELYRSADGVAYHIIKQFHPETFDNTANHFIYKDESPLRGKNHYRLVAYDRFTQQKKTVELMASYKNQPRKIQPNIIAKGRELNVLNYDGEELHLVIYTSGGSPLIQKLVNSSVIYLGSENLSAGMYIYQLMDKNKYVVNSGKFMLM